MSACVRCVRACMRACVRACVRGVCVCVCARARTLVCVIEVRGEMMDNWLSVKQLTTRHRSMSTVTPPSTGSTIHTSTQPTRTAGGAVTGFLTVVVRQLASK